MTRRTWCGQPDLGCRGRVFSDGCEPGTVTVFLGANGAGKTTTMRMLCGLSQPDAGEAIVLGGAYRDLPNPGRRVGILLDASAQHPGRRGRETLALSARLMGLPEKRVDALLELVGLDRSAARKRVRQYSLGMRQRLGLAHAMLLAGSGTLVRAADGAALAAALSAAGLLVHRPAEWLDSSRTIGPMIEQVLSATDWAKVATTLLLWLVLPLAIGLWRISRGDPR